MSGTNPCLLQIQPVLQRALQIHLWSWDFTQTVFATVTAEAGAALAVALATRVEKTWSQIKSC
jgi:hypothetical protein